MGSYCQTKVSISYWLFVISTIYFLLHRYQVDLTATGGDGKFLWSSSNHSVGMVNQMGHVRTHSYGFFEVTAAMQRNHHNKETAKLVVLHDKPYTSFD